MITLDDLNKLRDKEFEKLIKTLLLLVIGKGVTPFSQGKDGAREATFSGKAEYPSTIDTWEGNWIFQVKFSDISLGIDKARNQIKYTINSELRKLEDYGYLFSNNCENYIYITNVPFSGESEKGLHDYIAEKRKTYTVKNFHYWDGEKILALINSHPQIRETFFPVEGYNMIDDRTIKELKDYFVKPNQYSALKDNLLSKRIVNIVGQPHVGKTSMSMFLASELIDEKALSNIFLVPLIESLISIPKIKNSVIIFDDLYGDINYDTIGKKTKIINTLSRDNYIIITSRDYIFNEAEKNSETFNLTPVNIIINQEGSFTNNDLEEILKKHLAIAVKNLAALSKTNSFILSNSAYIVRQLRYPHNIQLFTTILDENTTSKAVLEDKITQAKKIEEVIQSWIRPQSAVNKNILLALSIGKVQNIELLRAICKTQWNYSENEINNCFTQNERIIVYKNGTIRFLHPSFKSAIINLFIAYDKKLISELIINLISHPLYTEKRAIYRKLAYDVLSGLNSEQLVDLLLNRYLPKNYIEICWLNLIRTDKEQALSLILKFKKENLKIYPKYFSSLIATKDFMKDDEIFDLVQYLLAQRHFSKVTEQLIVHFCFRIKNKIRSIIEKIDYKNNSRDLKLKIRLLGVIGSEFPDSVLAELESELSSKFKSTRSIVYASMNMLSQKYNFEISNTLERALKTETHRDNILKIEKSLRHRK